EKLDFPGKAFGIDSRRLKVGRGFLDSHVGLTAVREAYPPPAGLINHKDPRAPRKENPTRILSSRMSLCLAATFIDRRAAGACASRGTPSRRLPPAKEARTRHAAGRRSVILSEDRCSRLRSAP